MSVISPFSILSCTFRRSIKMKIALLMVIMLICICLMNRRKAQKVDRRQLMFSYLEQERRLGEMRLNNLKEIKKYNNDLLPISNSNLSATQMCRDNTTLYCLPPFKRFETELRSVGAYNISTCVIQKSMSTVMTAIFCFLLDEKNFIANKREIMKEWKYIRLCANQNEFPSMDHLRHRYKIQRKNNWDFIMITRDPVERFISGYVDKCIRETRQGDGILCNGCGKNMTCFIITEYERMTSQVATKKFFKTFEDRHFFPQNWRCNLYKEYNNFQYLKYSSDSSSDLLLSLFEIFRRKKIPEKSLEFIYSEVSKKRTIHSTRNTPVRQFLEDRLRTSRFLMEYLIRMFYYDFTLFHYDFPESFQ